MRSRRPLVPVPVLLSVAVLLLAGCGTEDDAGSSGSASSSAAGATAATSGPTSVAADDPDDGGDPEPFPADTGADVADPSADALVTVTDVRLGRHDGFDRVVLEVDGEGLPGWDVRYVDQPISQGKGDVVEVAGDAFLQVTITGVGYPFDTGVAEYAGPDPVVGSDTTVVTEVTVDSTFEGSTVAFVGTRAESPFRVYLLENPARVVIEVADPT